MIVQMVKAKTMPRFGLKRDSTFVSCGELRPPE